MFIRDRGLYGFLYVFDKSIDERSLKGILEIFFFFWGEELLDIFIQTDDRCAILMYQRVPTLQPLQNGRN